MAGKFDHLLPVYSDKELRTERWKVVRVDGELFATHGISNLGRVKNIKTGKILKLLWCHAVRGEDSVYWRVCLPKRRKGKIERKAYLVHRLVAEAFVPGRTKRKKIVHHKDNVSYNPRASNLEWVTYRKNLQYYYQWKKAQEWEERQESEISDAQYQADLEEARRQYAAQEEEEAPF